MLYDKDIREPLFEFLEEYYGRIRILEEKRIARSRSDVVMVLENEIIGIEIKSDADSYSRLSSQVSNYDLFFDKNIVVVGTSHAHHIEEHVPEYWGIITVEENEGVPDFYVLRIPHTNPNLDCGKKLEILWRPELAHIQEKNNMPAYNYLSKKNLREKILEKIPGEILWTQVCEELFERDYNTIREQIDAYRQARGQKKRKKNYIYKYKGVKKTRRKKK